LLKAMKGADDRIVDIEELDEDTLRKLAERYKRLAQRAGQKDAPEPPEDRRGAAPQ